MLSEEQLDSIINEYKLKTIGQPQESRGGLRGEELIKSLEPKKEKGRIQETFEDIKQTGKTIFGRFKGELEKEKEIEQLAETEGQGFLRTGFQKAGAQAGAISGAIGDLFTGAVKVALPQEREEQLKSTVEYGIKKIIENKNVEPIIQRTVENFEKLKEINPALARDLEAGFNMAMLGLDLAGGVGVKTGAKKGAGIAGRTTREAIETGIKRPLRAGLGKVDEAITSPAVRQGATGVMQTGKELAERFPRAAGKVGGFVTKKGKRAQQIAKSKPAVAKAIKSNLDDRIINTVTKADDVTKNAYKEIVDIAQESGKKLTKTRPEIVAGKAAESQFNVINNQRKKIGQQIGDTVSKISKSKKIDMSESYNKLKDVLSNNGISIGTGNRLRFSGKFTPKERRAIQELYTLAVEGGRNLSHRKLFDADRLFSKLQRETRLEGIGDLFVETAKGEESLFKVFRDVFSNKLEQAAPQIKELNKEYRKLKTLVDDIEKSIVKSGKFEATKGVDAAEFAQTNLRRILSNAQSAASFREIAGQMDKLARSLGYKGARPDDLIAFAEEIKKLFPDAVAPTGFAGQTRLGISDLASAALRAGKPDLSDQQKALIEMLEELTKGTKKSAFSKKTK